MASPPATAAGFSKVPPKNPVKKAIFRVRVRLRHSPLHNVKIRLHHARSSAGKFKNLFNPNHRHDEPHEQRLDQFRLDIAKSHRFESFAAERDGNDVKWYVDGRDYFWAVSEALESAKETIYIADWWLSPELFLRRPPGDHMKWRLDQVLKRQAEAGVKILVIVYKEVAPAVSCNSAHTKSALEELCPSGKPGHGNIIVMRHPDHSVLNHGADMTFYWAHHEKFIVIDHKLAFVGGLDLCFGRWDLHQHPLADVHPKGVGHEIWPGQDFNNNRVLDFQHVEDWEQNQLDKKTYGRMPWHDVSLGIVGPAVHDVAEHFAGRWNFVKRDKYKRHAHYPWLRLQGVKDELLSVERPKFPVGGYMLHQAPSESAAHGPCKVQLVRSSSDWSHGISPVEHSIQNAYKSLIEKAEKFIYIENQFFITATGDEQAPVHNTIGASIVTAVARAHSENRPFKVIIVIPAIPGFPGDLREEAATGTRAIIDYQYKSINRGEHSIYGRLKAQGVENPQDYIHIFTLRIYDRLHTTEQLLEREKETGVSYNELQKANAADTMGARGLTQDDSSSSSGESSVDEEGMAEHRRRFEAVEIGGTEAVDSIAQDAMAGTTKPSKEKWDDGEEQEKKNIYTEELYVHAKVLIVDDQYMVVGSSNINDRSQLGLHDSELSAIVEHHPTVSSLRRQLWQEHLGLLPPQDLDAGNHPNAQPPGTENIAAEDPLVEDPLSEQLWKTWFKQATTNTEVYRNLFHCDPDDTIKTWKDYDEFLPRGKDVKEGHLHGETTEKMTTKQVKKELDKIRGHLVWMPLEFLRDEQMAEKGLQVNAITESIYT